MNIRISNVGRINLNDYVYMKKSETLIYKNFTNKEI